MNLRRFLSVLVSLLVLTLVIICAAAIARVQPGANPRGKTIVVWIKQVHGRPLYWINQKPAGRAPLTGLIAATASNRDYSVNVIIDSGVSIQEMAEVGGLMQKTDVSNVRYFVYQPAYPKLGMSEIIWKPQMIPLPQRPPLSRR